jgi:Zn-finger protein
MIPKSQYSPNYIGFQEDNVGQSIWNKVRCSWEHAGEHIGKLQNMLRTWWEHIENRKNKIKIPTPPTLPKGKKLGSIGCELQIPPWVQYNF